MARDRVKDMLDRERQLAIAVRREFGKYLAGSWPQFERVMDADKLHPSFAEEVELPEECGGEDAMGGWRLYRWHADGIWFFLELGIKYNRFWFRLLWNASSDYLGINRYADPFEDPSLHASNNCGPNKQWKVGTNPAFDPVVVVPGAANEMKAFAEPIIAKVRERHGNASSPNERPAV